MGIFDKKSELSRFEFKKALKGSSPYLPGTGSKMFSTKDRMSLEKKIFTPKYGDRISKLDYQRALRSLRIEKIKMRTLDERIKADREIKYLKGISGIK